MRSRPPRKRAQLERIIVIASTTRSDSTPPPRIGVLGGTFDPVHIGHLILARESTEKLGLDRLLFVPARRPPHKDPAALTPAKHRVAMLELALEDEPDFEVDRREIERGGPSYTVDTLRSLREEFTEAEIFFLIGADSLPELKSWREPEQLFRLAHFVTVVRPGFPHDRISQLEDSFPKAVIAELRARLLETTPIAVSSTEIRRKLRQGLSIQHMVPSAVEAYIRLHDLYPED